jgi:type II secretory pathway component PulF
MALTPSFALVCKKLKDSVSQGNSLHDAMTEVGVFDELTLGLIRAGETSGALEKVFGQVKDNYSRADTIKRKVKKAMTGPAVVLIITVVCVFYMMWKTVPTFITMFSGAKVALPLPTRILISASHVCTEYPLPIFMGIVAFAYTLYRLPLIYNAFPFLHGFFLKLPVVGKLQKMMIRETFARTLLNLIRAGLKTIDAISLCREVSTCYPYKAAMGRALLAVEHGDSLMSALEVEKDIFGLVLLRSIGFGENTGKTDKVLGPIADREASSIIDYVDSLGSVIEPLMTLFIGGIIMVIMLALFLPIFGMTKVIRA